MSGGRPSLYTPELAEEVLRRLSLGEYITAICAEEGMPSASTVSKWKRDNAEFAQSYARARDDQALAVAERAVRNALAAKNDKLGRLAFDAEKWMASKLDPRNFGDKVDLNHTGEVNHRVVPDERLESRLTELLGKAGAVVDIGGAGASKGETED